VSSRFDSYGESVFNNLLFSINMTPLYRLYFQSFQQNITFSLLKKLWGNQKLKYFVVENNVLILKNLSLYWILTNYYWDRICYWADIFIIKCSDVRISRWISKYCMIDFKLRSILHAFVDMNNSEGFCGQNLNSRRFESLFSLV